MKYILMCGGVYDKFKEPKQLTKVNGEVLVERIIRLLKENGAKDIVVCTNTNKFDYLGLPVLKQNNKYIDGKENKTSDSCWLNAYYLLDEPCCYIHGDVYFSNEAIKTIVETPVNDIMFFCVRDIQDGRPAGVNVKGREPLAFKVVNNKRFNDAVNDIKNKVDEGIFDNAISPFSWNLYRYLNGLEYVSNDLGFINNIFQDKGDYIAIDDYTTDVDNIKDVEQIEKMLKIMKGEIKMVKMEVIKSTRLGKFNELKNLERKHADDNEAGVIYIGDTFECTEELSKYLMNDKENPNPEKTIFAKVIGRIPEEPKEEIKEEPIEEKPKKTTRKTAVKKTTKRTTKRVKK